MTLLMRHGRGRVRVMAPLAFAAALGFAACTGGEKDAVAPLLPGEQTGGNMTLKKAAFIMDLDTRTGRVKIIPAEAGVTSSSVMAAAAAGAPSPSAVRAPVRASLVAGDVVELTASNVVFGPPGAVVPGKVRVTVSINITNRLAGVELIGPTSFPTPPAGTTGPLLFPFEVALLSSSGSVSVGGDGTDVIFESPSRGAVVAYTGWDGDGTPGSGAPHNFFNDEGCVAASSDCFRWEEFPRIPSGATTTARSVDFLIDPTVGNFRARLLVAADLRNAGPTAVGSIAGSVTSPLLGPLAGVQLSVSGGYSGTTDAAGSFGIAGVNTGPHDVSIAGGLPAGCATPDAQSVSVAGDAVAILHFVVTCGPPTGTVSGTVTSPQLGALADVQLAVSGGFSGATNASGSYTIIGVSTGPREVSIAGGLPAGCATPSAQSVSVAGDAVTTVHFSVTCPPPVGSIAGSVTSPQVGALSGVEIIVSGGFTGTTDAAGSFSIGGIGVGVRDVSVGGGLPAGCTTPAGQSATVSSGGTATVTFSVTCPVPVGTIAGTLTSGFAATSMTGTHVIVTPAGGAALPAVTVAPGGAFSVPNVPLGTPSGTGSVSFANLPGGCANPGPLSYAGLTNGATVSLSRLFDCGPMQGFHTFTAVWSAVADGQVTLTIGFDPSTRNDPAINGTAADDFVGIQARLMYPAGRLTFVSAANGAGSPFAGLTANVIAPGDLSWLNFTTGPGQTGGAVVAVITFSVTGAGPLTVTHRIEEAVAAGGDLYLPSSIRVMSPELVP